VGLCEGIPSDSSRAYATPRSAAGAGVGISEGGAVAQRAWSISLSATRVIHGAVLDTLTADETSGGRAAAWVAGLYLVGKVRVFAFRPAATALDDFKHHDLSSPFGSFYCAAFDNFHHSAFSRLHLARALASAASTKSSSIPARVCSAERKTGSKAVWSRA
jgi:hypothetical protein